MATSITTRQYGPAPKNAPLAFSELDTNTLYFQNLPSMSLGHFPIPNPSDKLVEVPGYGYITYAAGATVTESAMRQVGGFSGGEARIAVSGGFDVSGSLSAFSITSSLLGTASYANYAQTASYVVLAFSASYVSGSNVKGTVSSSYTASLADAATTASYVATAQTASYVVTALTASYVSGSNVKGTVSSSYTASLANNATTASYVQTAQTASYVVTAFTASYIPTSSLLVNTTTIALGGTGSITLQSVCDQGSTTTTSVTAAGFYQVSKRSLKTNIFPFEKSALDIVNAVDVVEFNYKTDPTETKHIGIIADDSPEEIATKNKDTFDTNSSVAILMKAIQELTAKVNELEIKLENK